ncbi:Hypothetical protein NTJ_04993 [Nesidiocoris tenuis]|uniref:MICOS complex subunit MIC13 n=1 Tax=Nesidiocoris tenuis TaxID=355587 RepID=A0ABN7AIU9_9HEMI|nr:Hypothetical protein NTJ_04993 [Nesidiocoris tenuis]
MSCKRCQTINLAKVSIESLRCNANKLQNVPAGAGQIGKCEQPGSRYVPPPPRNIRPAKIQVCRPRAVDFVHPPVPCICPPCPICPSPAEQIRRLIGFTIKFGIFYFLFETSTRGEIWGNPDGSAKAIANLSNSISSFSSNADFKDSNAPRNVALLHVDKVKYTMATIWDKAIVSVFKWTVGMPLQIAHDFYATLEESLVGSDEGDDESHVDETAK